MNADKIIGPPDFKCPKKMKAWLAKLRDAVAASWPMNGGNVNVTDALGGNGKIFNAPRATGGSGDSTTNFFQISSAVDSTHTRRCKVTVSDLHDETPNGFLDTDTPPAGQELIDGLLYIDIPAGDNGVIYGKVTDDSDYLMPTTRADDPTARELGAATATPANTEHVGYEPIGVWSTSGTTLVFANTRYGPIHHVNTGNEEHQWG